ncbi:MAG: hypothetical protein ABNO82_01000 [Candidatus Shikimatogenerans sp. Tder]|uniref:Uncharacterized protein n=1 Tax=Candidatus Shikimatogenerans sp. Tder TaxID=3158566 RepID=A0AAU7QRT1_9FLAO
MKKNNKYLPYKLYNKILKKNLIFIKKLNLFNKAIIKNVIVIYTLNIFIPYIVSVMYISNIILINLIKKCVKKSIPIVFIYKNNNYGVLINIYKLIIYDKYIIITICVLEKVKINIIKKYKYYNKSNIIIIKDKLLLNKITNNDIIYIKKLALLINNNMYFSFLLENNIYNIKNKIHIINYIAYNIIISTKYKLKILNTTTIYKKFIFLKKCLIKFILKNIIYL